MTVEGTVNKTIILFLILLGTASLGWYLSITGVVAPLPLFIIGAIGGFIFSLIAYFNPNSAQITAPLYSAFEGLFIGALSLYVSQFFQGLIVPAIFMTMGIMFVMLFFYKTGIIKATPKFVAGMVAAIFGVVIFSLTMWVLRMFGMPIGSLGNWGIWGIVIAGAIVIIAALTFILDFAAIEENAAFGAPKNMEWLGALGIMMTLVWLYVSIIRLLMLLSGND